MSDEFYVYVNVKYTNIHLGECCFCQNGKGHKGRSKSIYGEWVGPFDNKAKATEYAKTRKLTVNQCAHCLR